MHAAQLGVTLGTLKVSVSSESDVRGLLGTDEKISAGLDGMHLHVQIGAAGASPEQLRDIVSWADSHSPVGCTARGARSTALGIEVVQAATARCTCGSCRGRARPGTSAH